MKRVKRDFSKSDFSIFVSYITPHIGPFAVDMGLSVLVAAIDLVFPYVSRWSMNHLLPDRKYEAFFTVMAIIFTAYILRAVMMYFVTVVGHGMGTLVEADMRVDIFSHMQELSFSYFDKHRTGVLLGRVTNDLFEIVELAHHGPENILTCSITILGAICILMTINIPLSLVILILLPVCVVYSMHERVVMRQTNVAVKKKTGEINAAIESGISGVRTSRAFANESAEISKFAAANEEFKGSKIDYYKAMGRFNAGVEATIGIIQVGVITAGGYMIMKGSLDFVDLITFALYVSTFTSPVRKLAQLMEIFTQGTAGYSRFLEVMRTEPEIKDAADAVELHNVEGNIDFDHVSFSYNENTDVLEDVNIHISSGEKFALVGSSGGGKTTLCHLIPRFYDVKSGSVSIDGHDVRSLTQQSIRKNVGIIQQDVFLFAGTILENIRYGRPEADFEEVVIAAKLAEIYDDIMLMPDRFDTYVGERGVVLSGGQKQRISIARVFLKDPRIVILDEATSALDSVTEMKIQRSLDRLCRGKTTIVIAHRLSTIKNADRIAVVDSHNIVEQGSREELLKLDGEYAALERAQALCD